MCGCWCPSQDEEDGYGEIKEAEDAEDDDEDGEEAREDAAIKANVCIRACFIRWI